MNVYDFDKTINLTDCSTDFFFFCMKKKPSLIFNAIGMILPFIKWKTGKINITQFKEKVFSYLKKMKNVDSLVEEFWNKNIHKSHGWYQNNQKDDDLVISASPEFLIAPACQRLGIKNYIATKIDKHSGKFESLNCSGEEKVKRFKEIYGDTHIEQFYSDSYSDTPLALMAQESFLVTKGTISPWIF